MQLDNRDGFWDWYKSAFVGVLVFLGGFAAFMIGMALIIGLISFFV